MSKGKKGLFAQVQETMLKVLQKLVLTLRLKTLYEKKSNNIEDLNEKMKIQILYSEYLKIMEYIK